jgi:hypothetical protein
LALLRGSSSARDRRDEGSARPASESTGTSSAEWRVFGLGYSDYRDGVVKTDNRPLPVRTADTSYINIGTYGGHYLQAVQSSAGTIDLLLWGALQNGSWGRLAQRSGAVSAEAGWQPPVLSAVRPWLRGGFDYGSGDGNPNDATHGTFFRFSRRRASTPASRSST